MLGYSKEYPAPVVKSRGMYQIRFNIKKIASPDGDGEQYQFEYQYAKEPNETEILKTLTSASVAKPEEILATLKDKDAKIKIYEIDPVTLKQEDVAVAVTAEEPIKDEEPIK